MSFQPADFPGFGGLNLAADAQDSPGALDLSNVTLSQPGPSRLLPRPGYTLAGTLDLSTVTGIAQQSIENGTVVVGSDTELATIAVGGTVGTSKSDYTTSLTPWTILPYGNPSAGTLPTATNPTFVTDTTGWTAGTSTITRDTGVFDSTPASGRWDNTGASDNLGASDTLTTTFSGTFLAGTPYSLTAKVKASGSTTSVYAQLGQGSDTNTETWSFTDTAWNTMTVSWTPTSNRTSVTLVLTVSTGGCYYNVDSLDLGATGTLYAADGANLACLDYDGSFVAPTVATQAAGATTYTAGRAAPKPLTLAAQPKDNRLVAAGFASATYGPNGTASSGSHVYFSQPDNPEKWDETDYVILSPGDGEMIQAACSWGDYLLIFKQSKFFVFYGNSVDSTGGTVFNYRTVNNAFGGTAGASPGALGGLYQGQVCVAPEGVYVITRTGVWLTAGGPPRLVSPGLSPLFNQSLSSHSYAGTGLTRIAPREDRGSGGSFFHEGQAWFSVTSTRAGGSTSGWLVLDTSSGQWTLHEFADGPTVGTPVAHWGGICFPSGLATVGRKGLLTLDGTATTDNGTAIASYYVSPYLTYGEPKAEKHVRASELHGTGTVTLAWGKDLQTHGTAETVAMSSGVGHARTGARGRVLSFKIAASAAGWTVNRVVPLLQAVRTGR